MTDMIRQSTHWDRPPRAVETPAARGTDPVTSHLAAESHTASGKRAEQQRMTAAAVREYPGSTMAELSKHTGIDRYVLGRRISECETAGLVKRALKRRCMVTGRAAEPWWPA